MFYYHRAWCWSVGPILSSNVYATQHTCESHKCTYARSCLRYAQCILLYALHFQPNAIYMVYIYISIVRTCCFIYTFDDADGKREGYCKCATIYANDVVCSIIILHALNIVHTPAYIFQRQLPANTFSIPRKQHIICVCLCLAHINTVCSTRICLPRHALFASHMLHIGGHLSYSLYSIYIYMLRSPTHSNI